MNTKKEFNKQAFLEGKCPNCESDDISEITGWCYNHGNPELNNQDLPFCPNERDDSMCAIVVEITDAFMCNQCDTMFDEHQMANWNRGDSFGNCPVGKEVPETPEEYADELFKFITDYNESQIDDCISQGHYLEAMGSVFIQISEQLRFLLIKRTKANEDIPLDPTNSQYIKVWRQFKKMKDWQLNQFAEMMGKINEEEFKHLEKLRGARNDFSHSFKARKEYDEIKLKEIIQDAKIIEGRLREEVRRYPPLPEPTSRN